MSRKKKQQPRDPNEWESVDECSVDRYGDHRQWEWRVTLDGEPVRGVVHATATGGAIHAQRLDDNGDPVVLEGDDGRLSVAMRWLKGDVEILRRPRIRPDSAPLPGEETES